MGVVYEALQSRANRIVALKMIRGEAQCGPSSSSGSGRGPGRRQASPSQCRTDLRGGRGPTGSPIFRWNCSRGEALKARLAEAPLPPRPAAELIVVLAGAVHCSSSGGYRPSGPQAGQHPVRSRRTPKITDFGLAKRLEVEDGQTLTGQVMGTPSYMAPEQASGKNRRSGHPPTCMPWVRSSTRCSPAGRRSRGRHLGNPAAGPQPGSVPPSRLSPRLPRDLETICLKCLAKEPSRRYETALDLAPTWDDISTASRSSPWPTPALERIAKWARRRPAIASFSAVGLLVVAVLTVAYVWFDIEVRERLRQDREHESAVTREATAELTLSQGLAVRGQLEDARLRLSKLVEKLKPEPRLRTLRGEVREAFKSSRPVPTTSNDW